MRILLATHAFPPRSTAGVEVYTLRLAHALRRRGHEVTVLAAVHDLGAEPYSIRAREHEGLDVRELVSVHPVGTLRATYDDPALRDGVRRVLEDVAPDVVHAQHLLNLGTGLLPEARATGALVLLTLHDYWLSCPRDGLRMRADLTLCATLDHDVCGRCLRDSPYLVPAAQRHLGTAARATGLGSLPHRLQRAAPGLVERALGALRRATPAPRRLPEQMDTRASALLRRLESADLILAPTRFALERARAFGVPEARLRHVPLGVLATPPLPRAAGPRRRFGYVGTLAPHKGVHVLVEAFRRLADRELRLELHGSASVFPGYVARLRALAGADERIRFAGPFPEGGQDAVLEGLDVLVQPSLWWENSPLSVIEALGTGRPVVASRTGGIPELVQDGLHGCLVPPGDVPALADALGAVARGDSLGDAAPAASLGTSDAHAAELEALYSLESTRRQRLPGAPERTPAASVVIPVRDGARWLPDLLDALEAQCLEGGLEIVAIDSGSRDGSRELLERRRSVRLLTIAPEAFDHGETRNLGVREARGAFVLFLSQDALPQGSAYAATLVGALRADPDLAGAWARQRPRDDADALTRRDLAAWSAGGGEPRRVAACSDSAAGTPLERYARLAFDNVASAARRDVLLAHPFAPSRFGEDVEWAKRVVAAGHGLAYVPEAVVVHSHRRTARGLYRRNYAGHRVLFRLFGLRSVPDLPHLARACLGATLSDATELWREGARARELLRVPAQACAATWGQYRGVRDEAEARPWPEWS